MPGLEEAVANFASRSIRLSASASARREEECREEIAAAWAMVLGDTRNDRKIP
jgi:hypothetical protein